MINNIKLFNIIVLIFFIYVLIKFLTGVYFIIINKKIDKKHYLKKIDERNVKIAIFILAIEILFSILALFYNNFISPTNYIIFSESILKSTIFKLIYILFLIYLFVVFDKMSNIYYRINRVIVGINFLLISYIQLTYFFI